MPIIRSSRVLYRWSLPVVFGALVFKLSVWCGAEGYVSGLQAAACMYFGLHVSYPLFLSDINETRIFLTDFRKILRYQIS